MVSGEHCRLGENGTVIHYDCDMHPDGTVTRVLTGEVVRRIGARAERPVAPVTPITAAATKRPDERIVQMIEDARTLVDDLDDPDVTRATVGGALLDLASALERTL